MYTFLIMVYIIDAFKVGRLYCKRSVHPETRLLSVPKCV